MHLDAAAIREEAQKREPNIDRATVYRTIDLLKKFRLVDELDLMHLNGEKHYYEVKTRRDHLHLACFHYGRIEEFATPLFEELKAEISRQKGFTGKWFDWKSVACVIPVVANRLLCKNNDKATRLTFGEAYRVAHGIDNPQAGDRFHCRLASRGFQGWCN